jgi:hypothetical protein
MPAPGRALPLAATALLICLLAFTGCTQPVIPSPVAEKTAMPTVATTQATSAPVTTVQATAGPDYLTYTNAQYGFTMVYPAAWNKQENTGTSVVVFSAPSQGMGDIPAGMRISVTDLSGTPMTLEQFKAAQLAKKTGLNLIYDQAYKGNGFGGWKVAFTLNQAPLMEGVEVYVIRGPVAYTLAYSAMENKYAGLVVPMDTMFKSFALNG